MPEPVPVRRNDPCPCGSGKKYKHCCGRPKPATALLYVHPAKQGVDYYAQHLGAADMGRPYGLIPMGVPALVNMLREAGIDVRGVNYPLEKRVDPSFDLRRWLRTHRSRARIVLIDCHWYEHAYGAISVAEVCREILPEAWIVLGGLTASGFAAEILETFDVVDIIVRGDAEAPLLALAQRLLAGPPRTAAGAPILDDLPNITYRDGGRVKEAPLGYCAASDDLARLNYADIDFLDHHDAYFVHEYIVTDVEAARAAEDKSIYRGRWIATARGCKYECAYCGGCKSAHQRLANRDGIVPRPPEAVVAELGRLAENRVIQASLSYDIAEMGRDYWRAFFSELRESGIKIGLYNEFFQLPEGRFIQAFARSVDMAHSCLAVSPLSGNERVRRLNGKHYGNPELFNTLDRLNMYNVPIFVYFSLNLPGEDDETIQETVELAKQIYGLYPSSLLKILTSCHTIDPLSPMSQHPERFGVEVKMRTFMDFYTYCRETQLGTPDARTGAWRGFEWEGEQTRSLALMADLWDAARVGRERSWWPLPPSW
jgi:radical SAM superfamily enzyme YgiQ (UPF0313 family)